MLPQNENLSEQNILIIILRKTINYGKELKLHLFKNHSFTYNSLNNLLFVTIFTIIEVDIGDIG